MRSVSRKSVLLGASPTQLTEGVMSFLKPSQAGLLLSKVSGDWVTAPCMPVRIGL